LRVIVSDDGIGIDASAARGFGLAGMKERANMHDGSLKISERKNGSGVTLVAELPIADAKLTRRPDQIDAVTKHQEAMPL
jgi:glucose-6-phosphate-specific signal transduction histidine kinase